MLRKFRKHQQNFIFSLLIIAIVGVMAMYGVNQFEKGAANGGMAAWVNGDPITNREFGQVLESRIDEFKANTGQTLDEKTIQLYGIPQRTLEQMVQYKLLAQNARKLGFRVPDEELADTIRHAPSFQRNGKFDPELYRRLPNRGLEEKRIRESMLIRRMQMYLAGRIAMPPEMIEREYQLEGTKANLSFAKVDFKAMGGKYTPSNAEVEAFLKSEAPDALKAYYDTHQREFTAAGAAKLRQIRVGLPFQASAEKKAEAKKKIADVAKQVNADNFEALARKYSDDENAKKGGNLGWINRGTLDRAIEDAINKLQPKEVSAPIETAFGYYLVQVLEQRPESVKPLDAVKAEIAKNILKEKKGDEMATKKRAEWDKKLAEGKSIEGELKAAGADIKKTGPFSLGQGWVPQIGQSDEILNTVFSLSKNKPVATKLIPSGKDYYYLKLESVEGPKASDYDLDRDTAAAKVEGNLQTALVTKWVEKLKDGASVRYEVKFESPEGNPFSLQ